MEKYNCLIVEDEPLAAEVLQDYIRQIPFLSLRGVCSDGLYALEFLKAGDIDVLFLDIHLPKLKGLDFIRTLKSPPQIIVTTAYREYALDGYELNVVDYLLKPISLNRFIGAVNKLRERRKDTVQPPSVQGNTPARSSFLININKKKIRIFTDEVLYIESKKEYINIVTHSEQYLAKYQLADIEAELDNKEFIRVHRSFLVSRNKIKAFTSTDVEVNRVKIPIGRSYKELVLAILDQSNSI
jgi:two-component system LytT family response regulator